MQDVRFLCLAVSRRDSGNCIAGIDIDSGLWLRPIRSRDRAAFADAELIVKDNHTHQPRFMAPLDLLSIPLEQHTGTNSQPENWIVAPRFFDQEQSVFRRCTGPRTIEFLLAHCDRENLLLHSKEDSVPCEQFASRALNNSLALVRPEDLVWKVAPHAKYIGKLQVRAEFRFVNVTYNLVVTDPAWEVKCHHAGVGSHQHSELAAPGHDLVLLTISLAAVPFHGVHYKLVAGVIELRALDFIS